MPDLNELRFRLGSLVLFRSILKDRAMKRFLSLLKKISPMRDAETCVRAYADFAAALLPHNMDFSRYLLDYIKNDPNDYLRRTARGEAVPRALHLCLEQELQVFQDVSRVTAADVREHIAYAGFLPEWSNTPYDFRAEYKKCAAKSARNGYGALAAYHMFTVKKARLVPVRHPDGTRLSDLSGYDRERRLVLENTIALLEGRPAANALLYGDSGTGKSSTVKAVANELAPRGLRLVEVKKSQLHEIPDLIEALAEHPLKFVLFIDDLSFVREDDDFGALKAILEGSVLARTDNLAVYATSNRRHLIRESFSDRTGDDVHANETVQQMVSLSDRFGLAVAFSTPGKQQYLDIVRAVAKAYRISVRPEDLCRRAEAYALEKGGRSPRVARQFIEQLASALQS